MNHKTLFGIVAAGLLLAFAVGALVYKSKRADQSAQLAERNRAHLVRMHSPTLGKDAAPVVIVEFLDPACGTCREFHPLVKAMMAAARKQGKFWPALEALLASQDDWSPNHQPQVALAWKHLEGLGLNLEQLRIDMTAPDIAGMIAQDLEDARALNVTKTPEFFVNGSPLPTFGYEQLKKLVDDALAATRR